MIYESIQKLNHQFSPFHFCLGGGNFDWTVDREMTSVLLNQYTSAGGNFVDTSDSYGNSEVFIGSHKFAEKPFIATKVGDKKGFSSLSATNISSSIIKSLDRLSVNKVDLYFAHKDDPNLTIEEIYHNFLVLYEQDLIAYAGISNFSEQRLFELLSYQRKYGKDIFQLVSYGYSLADRKNFETNFLPILREFAIPLMPFFPLAKGFLAKDYSYFSSKKQHAAAHGGTGNLEYRSKDNFALKKRLNKLARQLGVTPQEIALAFVNSRDFVFIPIAGARLLNQLSELLTNVPLDKSDLLYLLKDSD